MTNNTPDQPDSFKREFAIVACFVIILELLVAVTVVIYALS